MLANQFAERDAVDVLHHDKRRIAFANAVIHDVDGIGVMNARSGAGFLLEAAGDGRIDGELRLEYLDGDLLAHVYVCAAIDITHAAGAEQFFNPILALQRSADERLAAACSQIHRLVIRIHHTPRRNFGFWILDCRIIRRKIGDRFPCCKARTSAHVEDYSENPKSKIQNPKSKILYMNSVRLYLRILL